MRKVLDLGRKRVSPRRTAGWIWAATMLSAPAVAMAVDGTWNVNNAGNWSSSGNWLDGFVADGEGATANFTFDITANRTVTIDGTGLTGSRTLGVLNIGDTNLSHAYTITRNNSNILTLDGAGAADAQINVLTSAGGNNVISAPITLASNLAVVNQSLGELQLTGVVSGNFSITHNGPGVLALNANNSFDAGLFVAAGIVSSNNAGGFGAGTVTLGGSGDATLRSNANGLTHGNVIVVQAGSAGTRTIQGITNSQTFSGDITLNGDLTLDNLTSTKTTTISGTITGAADLTKGAGVGTVLLTGANAASFTGDVRVVGGTLQLSGDTGTLNSGSALTLDGNGTFNYAAAAAGSSQTLGALTFAAGQGTVQSTYGGGGNASLTFASLARNAGGIGNFVVSGGDNGTTNKIVLSSAPTAGVVLNAGVFFGGGSYAAYDAGGFLRAYDYATDTDAVIAPAGATMGAVTTTSNVQTTGAITAQTSETINTLNISGNFNFTLAASQTLTVQGILKTGNNGATFAGAGGITTGGAGDLVINTVLASDSLTISSPVLNTTTGGITKGGAGSAVLSGALGHSGGIAANTGTLDLRSTSNSFTGDIVVGAGATLRVGTDSVLSDAILGDDRNDIFLKQGSTLQFSFNNPASLLLSPRRTITIDAGGATIKPPYGNPTFNLSGNIIAQGTLTNFNGSLQLSGDNTFAGGIAHRTTLRFSSDANVGGPNSAFIQSNYGTIGYSIMGTSLTNLSGHSFTFAGDNGTIFDIQDPDNTFTWDRNFSAAPNSANSSHTLAKQGLGTFLITAPQSYNNIQAAAPDTLLAGGILKVDYAAGATLNMTSHTMAFAGGTFYLLGKGDEELTLNFNNVELQAGGGSLVADNQSGASSMTVNLGDFSTMGVPVASSNLNVRTVNPGTGGITVTTTATNTNGLLAGGRIVYNGTTFATNTTDTSGGAIGAYSGATAGLGDATVGSTTNYLQSGSVTAPAATTYAHSLKVVTTGADQSIDLNGQEYILTGGGLLFAGDDDFAISNGTLKSANSATTSDLIIHQYGAGTLTIDATIANGGSGASTLTIAGDGKVVLTSAASYTGVTYVEGAVLSVSANNQLSGTSTGVQLFNGTLQATETFSSSRGIALNGGGGTIDVAADTTLTLSGGVSGGRLTLANSDGGNGVLILSGNNSFASGVAINGGVLRMGNNGALNSLGLNTLSFGSATTQTLQINGGRIVTVAGLTSAATTSVIENGAAGAAVLNVYNGADNTYAGVIQDGAAGTLALTKAGAGILTLSNDNAYTGATAVYNGVLRVNGSLAAASAVTVADDGVLGGIGIVAGSVTIESGGTLAPGASVGEINTGALTFTGGTFAVEVNTSTDTADKAVVSGDVALGDGVAKLDLSFIGPGGAYAETFTLIDNTTANATTGYFADLQPLVGTSYAYDSGTGLSFTIDYAGGTGNDVTVAFTSVPEPATLSFGLMGGAMLLARRRRRR